MSPHAFRYREVVQAFERVGAPIDWQKTVWSYHHYNHHFGVSTNQNVTDGGRAGLAAFRNWYPMLMTEWNYWIEP